jgi:hypothetical protein
MSSTIPRTDVELVLNERLSSLKKKETRKRENRGK